MGLDNFLQEGPNKNFVAREIKKLHLKEWDEVVGIFEGIVEEDPYVLIRLDNIQLIFDLESTEAKILKEKLDEVMIGLKISILRTDISEKPILVRVDKLREDIYSTHPSTQGQRL